MSPKYHLIWQTSGLVISAIVVGYGFFSMLRRSCEPKIMLVI